MPRASPRSAALVAQIIGWPLLGLALAARLRGPRRSWPVDLLDAWLLHALAPWPALGLLAVRARSPSLALLAAMSSGLWLARARLALGQEKQAESRSGPRVRLMTANVQIKNPSAAGLAELVALEGCDVVGVQELRPGYAADLVERLGRDLPHYDVQPDERFAGAALFSRWPIEAVEIFRLTPDGHIGQHAQLGVDGQRLHVLNVHLGTVFEIYRRQGGVPTFGIRRRANATRDDEIERLLDRVAEIDEPTIVLGDFNASAGSRPYCRLRAHLRDAFQEVGRGLGHTFPQAVSIHGLFVPIPLLRIDYVFFKGCLEPLWARPLAQPDSDHRAVVAELQLT